MPADSSRAVFLSHPPLHPPVGQVCDLTRGANGRRLNRVQRAPVEIFRLTGKLGQVADPTYFA